MEIEVLKSEDFDKKVVDADKNILIDFYAKWCGPCRMMAEIIDKIAAENPDIKVFKVDIDEDKQLAQRFEITSIPTFLIFKNGKLIQNIVGTQDEQYLLKYLK
ncbi:MAG: thioredoxin [Clostridia bacterium]|nr:thioredoxin [Clostridia bacterium]